MISIEDTNTDIEEVRDEIVGGGVIPISFDQNGEILLLLGKERYISHWRGSLKWSGFEGGKKENESVEHIAAREFVEESMGVLALDKNHTNCSIDNVLNVINTDKYVARVLLCINHNENKTMEKRYHITYVIQVPLQSECNEKFATLRQHFVDFQIKLSQFQTLMDQLPSEYPFIKEDLIIKGKKVKAVTDVAVINNELVVTYLEEEGIHCIRKEVPTNDTLSTYLRWFSYRIQLQEELKKFKDIPDAISIHKNCLGFFVNAKLNEEYIEKQQIHWWKLNDLKDVLNNGGYKNSDFFRAYFMPVLQRVVKELEQYQRTRN
tara:strand:+ start:1224 stop:2183 length:960 start_codon:yes stop_codon:yes gene_type:complete